jgi:DNA-binding NarL/FixJ family response regulator
MGIIVAVERALRARWVGSPLMSFTRLLGLGLLLWATETESAQQAVAAMGARHGLRPVEFPDGLTAREAEDLTLIAAGRSNTEIASVLYVGVSTIKTHVNRVFAKIRGRSRTQAAAYARSHGLAP